jgi:hypothetical protein
VNKLFIKNDDLNNPRAFSYYKYMGSFTSPPCAENVVWFVLAEPVKLGSTALSMLRDALNPPGKTPHDKFPNYDGSNRLFIFASKFNLLLNFKNNSYFRQIMPLNSR